MYTANVYNIFIASPSDVKRERELAIEIINKWNRNHSAATNICLLPLLWENNLAPNLAIPGQKQINEELLEKADLLIAFFWTRIGTKYQNFKSATVAEIEFHVQKKKPTIVLFSTIEVGTASPLHQLDLVQELKIDYYNRGLVQEYFSHEDFKEKLYSYVELTINQNKNLFAGFDIARSEAVTIENLSEHSQTIISKMAQGSGKLMVSNSMQGLHIQSDVDVVFSGKNDIDEIEWEDALQELVQKELINQKSQEMYALTLIGLKLGKDFNKRFLPIAPQIKKPIFAISLKWTHGFRTNQGASYLNDQKQQPINVMEVIWSFEISNTYSFIIKNISDETAWNIKVINEDFFDKISEVKPLASLTSAEFLELEGEFIQYYQGSGMDADKLPRIPEDKTGKGIKLMYLNSEQKEFEDYFIFDGKQFIKKV